jgi:hypothetical protein
MTCTCKNEFCYRCGRDWVMDHNCQQETVNDTLTNQPIIEDIMRLDP